MKNLFVAIWLVVAGIFILWISWVQYARISDLHDNGREGSLSVFAETRTSWSIYTLTTHFYDASIAGLRVRLKTSDILSPGHNYPVLFSEEKLREYTSQDKGVFYAYKIGRKTESKWAIFVRDEGVGCLLILAALVVIWVVSAWLRLSAFKKGLDIDDFFDELLKKYNKK